MSAEPSPASLWTLSAALGQIERLHARERAICDALGGVCDGGQYLNDILTRIEKLRAAEAPSDAEAAAALLRSAVIRQERAAELILAGFRSKGRYGPDPLRDMAIHAAQILNSHGMLRDGTT